MGQAHKILVLIAYVLSRQTLGFPHRLRMKAEEGQQKNRPLAQLDTSAWQFKGGYCAYVIGTKMAISFIAKFSLVHWKVENSVSGQV